MTDQPTARTTRAQKRAADLRAKAAARSRERTGGIKLCACGQSWHPGRGVRTTCPNCGAAP